MKNNLHIHGCRMQSVTDGGTNDGYFAVAGNYDYDANGNMTSDPSKGTGVEYNYLNLPGRVSFGGNGEVRYTCDAAGNKRLKDVIPAAAKRYCSIQLSG